MISQLRTHPHELTDGPLRLRPLTEADWPTLQTWYEDPDVLYWSEGDPVLSRTLDETKAIYRAVSQTAFVFLVLLHDEPIGDAWLQRMNLPLIQARFDPEVDLRRIDLVVGRKDLWSRGWGTRIIALLTQLGFDDGAEAVFACDIKPDNVRCLGAFRRNGYENWASDERRVDLIRRR